MPTRTRGSSPWTTVPLFVLVCALWGLAFIAMKVAMRHAEPVLLATVRVLGGGLLVLGWCALSGRRWLPDRSEWGLLFWLGVLNAGLLNVLMFLGQLHLAAGLGAILLYTYPLLTALLAPLLLHERLTPGKGLGVLAGFGGVVLIAGVGGGSRLGALLMLGAAVCWSLGTLLLKRWVRGRDMRVVSGWLLVLGGLFAAGASLLLEGWPRVEWAPGLGWSMLYLVGPGTAIAYALWFHLLERGEAARASAYLFMTPVFAVLFGWWMLGEALRWAQLAGGALVAVSIFLVSRQEGPRGQAPRPLRLPGGARSA